MTKLHLDIGNLRVESFATDITDETRGTVRGQSIIEPTGWTYCLPCGGGSESCGCEPSTGDVHCTRPAVCGPQQTT